jgi:GT2 family glycosyltransferase
MNDQSTPDISVCFVNLNTKDLLRDCLKSIFEQKWQVSLEVIVVDNASTDGSVAMLRREFPQVKVIANPEYRGFAGGNNQAFAAAKGRYLLMLNTDTIVLPGAFEAMVEFMDHHPEAGALGCKVLNRDGTLQRSCWRGYPSLKHATVEALYLWRLMPGFSWVRASEIKKEELEDTLEVDHLLGACLLIRREVIEQLGGLKEEYIIYLEDTDLCYRMKKANWRVYYDPKGQIIHYGQQTGHVRSTWSLFQGYRNYCRFCRDNNLCSARQIIVLKGVIMLASMVRMGLWLFRMLKEDRALSLGMVKGYWSLFRNAPTF